MLDVQFLPDVNIVCPDCHGSRYGADASSVRIGGDGTGETGLPLPELMAMTVDQAAAALADVKGRGMNKVRERLAVLSELGLGYLTLGEATPALSGGEAQRLKLASEIGRDQSDTLLVFDEPTIGLHPLDVQVLLGVLQRLLDSGATVLVIDHDLDMIAQRRLSRRHGTGWRRLRREDRCERDARAGRREPSERYGALRERGAVAPGKAKAREMVRAPSPDWWC